LSCGKKYISWILIIPASTSIFSVDVIGFGNGAADERFILYQNMSNTNKIQGMYSKH